MSDINIEDFIHETRSMMDDYDNSDSRDGLGEIWSEKEAREYLDRALTLARCYDKLLRELDVANARQVAPYWPVSYPATDTGTPMFPPNFVGVAGTVWETATPSTAVEPSSGGLVGGPPSEDY